MPSSVELACTSFPFLGHTLTVLFVVADVARRATVEEECPKCRNPTMNYWTMQLRSADEGQTVFYECPKCHHTFSTNT